MEESPALVVQENQQSVLNFINARGLDLLVDLVEQQQPGDNYSQTITRHVSIDPVASSSSRSKEESNLDLLSMLCEQRVKDEERKKIEEEQCLKRRLSESAFPMNVTSLSVPAGVARTFSESSTDEDRSHLHPESMIPLKKRIKRFASLDPNQLEEDQRMHSQDERDHHHDNDNVFSVISPIKSVTNMTPPSKERTVEPVLIRLPKNPIMTPPKMKKPKKNKKIKNNSDESTPEKRKKKPSSSKKTKKDKEQEPIKVVLKTSPVGTTTATISTLQDTSSHHKKQHHKHHHHHHRHSKDRHEESITSDSPSKSIKKEKKWFSSTTPAVDPVDDLEDGDDVYTFKVSGNESLQSVMKSSLGATSGSPSGSRSRTSSPSASSLSRQNKDNITSDVESPSPKKNSPVKSSAVKKIKERENIKKIIKTNVVDTSPLSLLSSSASSTSKSTAEVKRDDNDVSLPKKNKKAKKASSEKTPEKKRKHEDESEPIISVKKSKKSPLSLTIKTKTGNKTSPKKTTVDDEAVELTDKEEEVESKKSMKKSPKKESPKLISKDSKNKRKDSEEAKTLKTTSKSKGLSALAKKVLDKSKKILPNKKKSVVFTEGSSKSSPVKNKDGKVSTKISKKPRASEEDVNPWFAIRRSERIFFAHEFGPSFALKDKESTDSDTEDDSDNSETEEEKEKTESVKEDKKSNDAKIKRPKTPTKTTQSPSKKTTSKEATCLPKKTNKRPPRLEKFLKSDASQPRRSLDVESTVSTSSGSDSPQEEASRAGSVYCWEFQGTPVKKSYSKASSLSPNSTSSSLKDDLMTTSSSPTPGKKTGNTIRKDFFSSVKRTRIVSPSASTASTSSCTGLAILALKTIDDKNKRLTLSSPSSSTTGKDTMSSETNNNNTTAGIIDRSVGVKNSTSKTNNGSDHEKKSSSLRADSKTVSDSSAMILKVGDCAIFCSSSNNYNTDKTNDTLRDEDSQLPFIGRIESFWREVKIHPPVVDSEAGDYNLRKSDPISKSPIGKRRTAARSPFKGDSSRTASPAKGSTHDQEYDNYTVSTDDEEKMMVKVRWFYHPSEAVPKNKKLNPLKILKEPEGGLFESLTHSDENDVQTISCKCLVLPFEKFKKRKNKSCVNAKKGDQSKDSNNNNEMNKVYYLAGKYEPLKKEITYDPEVPLTSAAS
jgi:hypothetical protein